MPSDHPIFALTDRFVDEFGALRPLVATYLGVTGHDDRWDDLSPDGIAAERDLFSRYRREVDTLPAAGDRFDALAIRVFTEWLDTELRHHEHGEPWLSIGHLNGHYQMARETLQNQGVATAEARADVRARLTTMDQLFSTWRQALEKAATNGDVVARRQVTSTIKQLRAGAEPDGCFARVVGIGTDEADDDDAVAAAAAAAACAAMADWLESSYLPLAAEHDAVGRERYTRLAEAQLGMELDVEEAYAWAWDHVAELRARMLEVAAEIDPGRDLDGVVELLKTDPERACHSQDEFVALMTKRMQQALDDLDGVHFDVPAPVREFEVRMAPPGAGLGAFYMPPAEDWSRPGTTYWSKGDEQFIPLYEEISTAYHEGFPGHHLQLGTATSLADRLSRHHRLLAWHSGYGEGWALYTERLMDELGYFEKPDYVFGQLASSMLRAARVVIDIGLHLGLPIPDDAVFHPGEAWSFDLAVEMLHDWAFLSPNYAKSEVIRYLGMPGQAITYKLGERVILALREERRLRDGDAFDLKAFHADLVGSGSVGLDHLRELVLR